MFSQSKDIQIRLLGGRRLRNPLKNSLFYYKLNMSYTQSSRSYWNINNYAVENYLKRLISFHTSISLDKRISLFITEIANDKDKEKKKERDRRKKHRNEKKSKNRQKALIKNNFSIFFFYKVQKINQKNIRIFTIKVDRRRKRKTEYFIAFFFSFLFFFLSPYRISPTHRKTMKIIFKCRETSISIVISILVRKSST